MQSVALKDLINAAPEGQRKHAESVFDRVFDSLMWTRVVSGKVEDISPLQQWSHRQPVEIENDLAHLEINRSEILSALSTYLECPALESKPADWLFLNVLAYAEYLATVSEIRKKLMGIERYIKSLFPPNSEHTTDVSNLAARPWRIPMALASICAAWALHPSVSIGVTIYAVFAAYRQRMAVKKLNATLESMLQAYLSFNSTDLSWRQVTINLERAGGVGAIWDSSLYALAERRTESRYLKL